MMAKLLQQIDHVSTHITETIRNEQALVQSLGDALNDLDQQLLRDIRQVAADHQIRRGTILNALEDLAGSIGMFPPQGQDAPPESAATPPLARPQPAATAILEQIDYGYQYAPNAGDWRQATKNVSLQDELEFHLNDLNGKGPKH
jgi:hypothetical protein